MKRTVKKLLSILTALTLFISLVLPAGVLPAFATTDELIAYVDLTNGDDETGTVGNSTSPYATIAAAVSAIDAEETNLERVVQFTGTSTELLPAHTNMITIRGVDTTNSVINVTNFSINGPTKFENCKFSKGEGYINTNYNELILGDGFTTAYAHVMTGNRWSGTSSETAPEKITVNSGLCAQRR